MTTAPRFGLRAKTITRDDLRNPLAPWRNQAACRDEDPELFFPMPGQHHAVAAARAICHRCPVKAACAEAGKDERYGIWGGTTVYDRDVRLARDKARYRRNRRERQKQEKLEAMRKLASMYEGSDT
jgi:WhiB family redox-sensing transcriptional regulator